MREDKKVSKESVIVRHIITGFILTSLILCWFVKKNIGLFGNVEKTPFRCPETSKIVPESVSELDDLKTDEYRNHSLNVWRGAVKIYTPSFDDLGPVGNDSRWDVFYDLEKYLRTTFSLVNNMTELVHVNTHGLVFILHGTDENLKPVVLTGHQDVVPVPKETVGRWTHPPLEGYFDGTYLWGRGSSDCRNNVIGILEAMEKLLAEGFHPKRSVILAFGFDEESKGLYGAAYINRYLLQRFGRKSMFLIIDEGGLGIQDIYGSRLALPSTGEKGYVDVIVDLFTNGGHSSVPPKHTSIGIASELVTLIEKETYPLRISDSNPFYYQLQCEASKGKDMDSKMKENIRTIDQSCAAKRSVLEAVDQDIDQRYLVSTSQAVDIFNAGLKINALPDKVTVKINHRIAYGSSVDEVMAKVNKALHQIADKYDLGIHDKTTQKIMFEPGDIPTGYFEIHTKDAMEPAPVTDVNKNPSWDILAGTTRYVFEDFAEYPDSSPDVSPEVTVSPSVMTGNTDTKNYWNLSDNIYRFTPIRQNRRFNAHGIDERVDLTAHIEGVAFYYEFLKNIDHYDN